MGSPHPSNDPYGNVMVQQQPKRKTTRRVNPKFEKTKADLTPRTEKQEGLLSALSTSNQVIVLGPAGTGKTYVTTTYASNEYLVGAINKIVITRPHVAVGKDLGFLPGDLAEKTHPWAMPVLDVLREHLGANKLETDIKNGNIEVAPLALIRGRTFNDAFIIVDEAQNLTIDEVKALLTRVGENSTIVLNGDAMQSDLKREDGLTKILHLSKKHMLPVATVEFEVDDIVRSETCKMWVETFMKEGL